MLKHRKSQILSLKKVRNRQEDRIPFHASARYYNPLINMTSRWENFTSKQTVIHPREEVGLREEITQPYFLISGELIHKMHKQIIS